LYSSPNVTQEIKSRRMRWVGYVAWMGNRRGPCRVLAGDHLEDPRHRWEDNIKIDLQEVEWEGMAWIVVSQDGNGVLELLRVENELFRFHKMQGIS
jgi:hypothetical protein